MKIERSLREVEVLGLGEQVATGGLDGGVKVVAVQLEQVLLHDKGRKVTDHLARWRHLGDVADELIDHGEGVLDVVPAVHQPVIQHRLAARAAPGASCRLTRREEGGMVKLGIIICDRYRSCAGGKCFRSARQRDTDEIVLLGELRNYLKTIIDFYGGGPVGIEAISATLQEETDTLVDVVEPYLLKIGMVIRTSSGRRTSEAAYHHLGVPIQQKLF